MVPKQIMTNDFSTILLLIFHLLSSSNLNIKKRAFYVLSVLCAYKALHVQQILKSSFYYHELLRGYRFLRTPVSAYVF